MATITEPLLAAAPLVGVTMPTVKRSSGPKWNVTRLDSLNLTVSGLKLGSAELSKIPKTLLDRVYAGYTKVLRDNEHLLPQNVRSLDFSVTDDQMTVKSESREVVVPFVEDKDLKKSLAKVVDKARVYFPESFTAPRTLPTASAPIVHVKKDTSILNGDTISEGNSVARNAASLSAKAAASNVGSALIGASGIVGGALSLAIGKKMVDSGMKTYRESTSINDTGGRIDGALTAGIGASFAAVGVTMTAGFTPAVVTALKPIVGSTVVNSVQSTLGSPAVAGAFSIAGAAAISLMAVFMFAKTVHSWRELSELRGELTSILEDQKISSETKAKQGITFLAQQIYVTEGEASLLQEKYGSNPEELKTQMENKAKAKWAKFVRNVGADCAAKIATQIDSVIVGMNSNNPDEALKAIDLAVHLLQAVDKASYEVRIKQAIVLFLSFLYLAVGIISLCTPLSPAVAALYMAGAALFLLVDWAWLNGKLNSAIFAIKSDPNKLWKPLANRAELVSQFQIDRKWHLNKLKTRLEEALKKVSDVSLNVVGKDGRETLVGKITDFNHLCTQLKLADVDFNREAIDYQALTLEQIRALRFMDLLQEGILGVHEALAEMNLGSDIQMNAELVSTQIQSTFNEDLSKALGEINVTENHVISPQFVDAV